MRSELPEPWLVLQQEQLGRYLGSEQSNKPPLGRRNSSGVHLLANLFLTLSSIRAPGTPSARDLSPPRCSPAPSLCLQSKPSWGIPRVPEPLEPWESWPGTWWRKAEARCMAVGQGGAALPAGPRWTGHLPGSRGSSWLPFLYSSLREKRRSTMRNFGGFQTLLSTSPCPDSFWRIKGVNMHWDHTRYFFVRCPPSAADVRGSLHSSQRTFLSMTSAEPHRNALWSARWVVSYPHSWWRNKAQGGYMTPTQPVTKGKGLQIMPDARTQATASPPLLFFMRIFTSSTLRLLLHSTNTHDCNSQGYPPETRAQVLQANSTETNRIQTPVVLTLFAKMEEPLSSLASVCFVGHTKQISTERTLLCLGCWQSVVALVTTSDSDTEEDLNSLVI